MKVKNGGSGCGDAIDISVEERREVIQSSNLIECDLSDDWE